jgi:hypothetical protein
MVHLSLGVVFIHAFAGGIITLLGSKTAPASSARVLVSERVKTLTRSFSTAGMALVAWLTVLSGTWITYPWYRAKPPTGVADTAYPQAWLEGHGLSFWHDYGMEWKEHVGWLAPFLATAVAFVALRYPRTLNGDKRLRGTVTTYFTLAFAAAVIAGLLGAIINNVAPNQFLAS